MLYRLLQFPARIALHFYCRSLSVNCTKALRLHGPLILAANHPNSFLDAIVMASIFRQPVYSLARGDAFVSGFVNRILYSFNMLPVFRISEGKENLENNYDTFDKVQALLKQNKTILIFSEGRCINEWHLRPLKKGTARLAISAWKSGIPLRVLPVGINYSNFRHFGKKIDINFGKIIHIDKIPELDSPKAISDFNQILNGELHNVVYEIPKEELETRRKIFGMNSPMIQKILLAIPAAFGYLLNAPLFYAAKSIIINRANDHYDSIMVGILFLFYPVYLLVVFLLLFVFTGSAWSILSLAIMPLTALALLHYRDVL